MNRKNYNVNDVCRQLTKQGAYITHEEPLIENNTRPVMEGKKIVYQSSGKIIQDSFTINLSKNPDNFGNKSQGKIDFLLSQGYKVIRK